MFFLKDMGYLVQFLLSMLAAKREPAPCCYDAYSVGAPMWAFREKYGQTHCKTTFSPLKLACFASLQTDHFLFLVVGYLDASHWQSSASWSWKEFFYPWSAVGRVCQRRMVGTYGDLAMDSCAQFLAAAEHRLIPSRARSICRQLRRAGYQSVWFPTCQDQVAGGHAGVGICYSRVPEVLQVG